MSRRPFSSEASNRLKNSDDFVTYGAGAFVRASDISLLETYMLVRNAAARRSRHRAC
jgi:hypothetical protein